MNDIMGLMRRKVMRREVMLCRCEVMQCRCEVMQCRYDIEYYEEDVKDDILWAKHFLSSSILKNPLNVYSRSLLEARRYINSLTVSINKFSAEISRVYNLDQRRLLGKRLSDYMNTMIQLRAQLHELSKDVPSVPAQKSRWTVRNFKYRESEPNPKIAKLNATIKLKLVVSRLLKMLRIFY